MTQHRQLLDLVRYKVETDLRAEAARTYLGFVWWVLDPILLMLVFYVLFGLLLQRGGEHFVQFLLVGLVFWRWYHVAAMSGANSLMAAHGLIRQTYLPKFVLPLVAVLTDSVKFAVVLVMLLVFLALTGFGFSLSWLALIPLLAVQFALLFGLGLVFAALVPFLPDLRQLIGHLLQMQFFLSGIFYDPNEIPEAIRRYFFLNPMAALIDAYRTVLLEGRWPDSEVLFAVGGAALALSALALWLLHRYDRHYPKIVRG